MMEERAAGKSANKSVWHKFKNAIFEVFVEMLKGREVLRVDATILLVVGFLQIFGTVFEDNQYLRWDDDIASSFVYSFFQIIRVIPMIANEKAASLYWLVYSLFCVLILSIIGTFAYLVVCICKKRKYSMWPMNYLKTTLLFFCWIFYAPILECTILIMRCDSHNLTRADSSLQCYSGVHIFLLILSAFMLILAIIIAFAAGVLYQKTEPSSTDALAQLENPISLELIAYRTILFIVAGFDESMLGVFLIQCFITILSALIFVYQYVKYMPYFDNYVSITFGFLCFLLVWVVVNFALTYVIPLTGHFIVLLIGIIPVFLLVKNMRARFLEELLLKAPEKVATELEAITQCYAVYTLTMAHSDPEQEIRLIGLINVHLKECQKPECPLTSPGDLYDPCTDKHVNSGDTVNLHNNPIFLKHYAKMYFEAAISNFGNYPGVRIAYASFLFHAFRNVHAALNELSAAKKSKPNIMQSFEIYKFEQTMQAYMQSESAKNRELYYNLTRVLEFERIFKECVASMWQTCDAQLVFWGHLQQSSTVDFNVLDKDGEKIQRHAGETEGLWMKLCKINRHYPRAMNKYATYLKDIRNNEQLSNEILEKSRTDTVKKSLTNFVKNNDTLFDEKTSVIHVSGSKDAVGKILKTNGGTRALFGFSANELVQNSVSKIMPGIFGKKHNDFMEHYFRTGRSKVFNKERFLFGQHKDGFCFQMRLLVRQMPTLESGFIQYVGLIIKVPDDFEYILTDTWGTISSLSEKLALALGINHKWVHYGSGLNVQLLAPDLITAYAEREESKEEKKSMRYKEAGGEELLLVVPEEMSKWINDDSAHRSTRKKDKRATGTIGGYLARYNNMLNQRKKSARGKEGEPSAKELWELEEYKTSTNRAKVKCQIQDMRFASEKRCTTYVNTIIIAKEIVKVRVLKISGLKLRRDVSYQKEDEELTLTNQDMYKESSFLTDYDEEGKKVVSKEALISNMILKICQTGSALGDNSSSLASKLNPQKSTDTDKVSSDNKAPEAFPDLSLSPDIQARKLKAPLFDSGSRNLSKKPSEEGKDPGKGLKKGARLSLFEKREAPREENKKPAASTTTHAEEAKKDASKDAFAAAAVAASNVIEERNESDEREEENKDKDGKEKKEPEEDKFADLDSELEINDEGGMTNFGKYTSEYNDATAGISMVRAYRKEEGEPFPPEPDVNDFDEHNVNPSWAQNNAAATATPEQKEVLAPLPVSDSQTASMAERVQDSALEPVHKSSPDDLVKQALKNLAENASRFSENNSNNGPEELKGKSGEKSVNLGEGGDSSANKPLEASKPLEIEIKKEEEDAKPEEKVAARLNLKAPLLDISLREVTSTHSKADSHKSHGAALSLSIRGPMEEIKLMDGPKDEGDSPSKRPKKIAGEYSAAESMYQPSCGEGKGAPAVVNRRIKIMDAPMVGAQGETIAEDYTPTEKEMELRRHFYMIQMKDKKGKDKDRTPEKAKGEDEEESKELLKKDGKGDEEEGLGNKGEEEEASPDGEDGGNVEMTDDKDDNKKMKTEENLKNAEKEDEGSIGSTSTGSTVRAFYSIRAAVDEKFVPKSIKNMNIMTIFMFLLVLGLAITYYVFENTLYSSIRENIYNIGYSEDRQSWLFEVNLQLRTLLMICADNNQTDESLSVLDMSSADKDALRIKTDDRLKSGAISLKNAQTELSLKTSNLSPSQLDKINPSNVNIKYKASTTAMPTSYNYTISQAMLEVVVSSFKLLNVSISEVTSNEFSAYLIMNNSLNSILVALGKSTNEIVIQIEDSRDRNMTIFLILLLVASGASLISTVVLVPVIVLVKKNKENVLRLFLYIKKEEMKSYQNKCEKFKRLNRLKDEQDEEIKAQLEEKDTTENNSQAPEGETKEQPEHKSDLKKPKSEKDAGGKEKEKEKTPQKSMSRQGEEDYEKYTNRKHKEIVRNFSTLVIKILFFVAVIECFFIIMFFSSRNFLDQVSHLVTELRLLISRAPTHSFLMLIEKDIIFYNSTTTIEFEPAATFVENYHKNMYDREEQLLDQFASNSDYHTSGYNKLFKNIVFSNLCAVQLADSSGTAMDQATCEGFNEGILKQGLYSSVIKFVLFVNAARYWDYLRQLNSDFFSSRRQLADVRRFINDDSLEIAERMQEYYFKSALDTLVRKLEDDIDTFFSSELNLSEIVFIIYVVYLFLSYVIAWRLLLYSITDELWRTKSLLGIIPPEVLMENENMRKYILENSSSAFFSKKTG